MDEPVPRRRTVAYTTWQVRRVITVLAWLQNHPDATLMAASARFGVSVPQLRHELTQASTCGIPPYLPGSLLEVSTSAMHAEVVNSLGLRDAPALTESETGAVLLSLERLASVLSADGRAETDAVSETLRTMQENLRNRRENYTPDEFTRPVRDRQTRYTSASTPAPANLTELRDALRLRRRVHLTYRSVSSDSVSGRTLIPDHLEFIDGEGYLWARAEDGAEQRCYSVSRMSGVVVTPDPAPAAVARVVDEHDPFGFDRDDQRWAEVELRDDAAWMFEYLPMWRIDSPGPLRAMIPDTGEWLERFLIGHAPQIRAVTTSAEGNDDDTACDLRHRTARRVAAALDAYRSLA